MGKKFLLVTASIGSGHEKAAGALAEGIEKYFPEAEVNVVDFMRWDISVVNAFMKWCYLNMLYLVPNLYEFMYQFTAGKKKGGFIQYLMAKAMAHSIKQLIRHYEPDVIICTHPFPADAVSHLSKRWRQRFVSVAVITDYSVHQMWICPHLDLYFVGCEFMKGQLIADGIAAKIIHVTGIPVAQKFYQNCNRAKCREKLNLTEKYPVVVLMGGGLGLGNLAHGLEQLSAMQQILQIIVVAGKNHELRQQAEKIAQISPHRITVLGYTDQISAIMGAADILVTKPGALTLTEAMSLQVPLLLHEPIPGPETDNARYMSGHGMAIWLHAGDNLAYVLEKILQSPQSLQEMREAAQRHRKPDTVQKMLHCIEAALQQAKERS